MNDWDRFVHRLALAFGMPIRQLLREMHSSELSRWMRYYQEEPFGEIRSDLRNGILASIVLGLAGQKSEPADFIISNTGQDIDDKLRAWAQGGK